MGRVTKGLTHHSFFFLLQFCYSSRALSSKQRIGKQRTVQPPGVRIGGLQRRGLNGFWLPLFISFCLFPSEPALCKLGLAREGTCFFTSHNSFWNLLLDSSNLKFLSSHSSQYGLNVTVSMSHRGRNVCLFVQIYFTCLAHAWHPISVTAWSYSFCKFLNPNKFWP